MRPQISHRPLLTRGVAPMLTFGGQNVDCNPAGRKPSKRDLGVKFATVCGVEWNVYAAAFTPPKWCNCAYGFCTHESLLTKF